MERYDVVIVGAGPAGLAAAKGAASRGASVLLLERESSTGGVLKQCIHDGFGLSRYRKQLTGPEYAERALAEASDPNITIKTDTIVTAIKPQDDVKVVTTVSRDGLDHIQAKSVVLAMGCRERTRGMIQIPGTRPAGVFTAGVAQNLINTKNIMVGRRVVILGSGDIGLIMARRMTLEGAKVLAVAEVMPAPCGLARNIRQCLYDFGIPLYLSHTVTKIYGADRLTGVDICEVDADKKPIEGRTMHFDCDTLVLSVGLIPENEVSLTAGVQLNPQNGTVTDAFLQTSVPGIFSCGNSRKVMDLADYVSMQGELAGANAAAYAKGEAMGEWKEELSNPMPKGLPPEGSYTCVLCPNGCNITIASDGSVCGNRCKRGEAFIRQETTAPERILTTTVKVLNCDVPLVPVRTDRPVRLSEMSELVDQLNSIVLENPVPSGTVVAEGLGINKVSVFTD